jgi:hypothetical protein
MSLKPGLITWILAAILVLIGVGISTVFPYQTQSVNQEDPYRDLVMQFGPRPDAAELVGKQVVRVGVYILSVGNLDTTTGTYTIDFFLNFKCETIPCDPSNFDLINSAAEPFIEEQTTDEERGTEYYYRVRSNLQTRLDLKDFPFDSHQLKISLEDKLMNSDEYVFIVDPSLSGIDSSVLVSGWDLQPKLSADNENHEYKVYGESFSRARFFLEISHPWFSAFMKSIFAAIVIVGVGMLSFLMSYEDAQDRIGLTSGTLASAIFYHLTLTSSVPPVGYLTYGDQFMILQYVFITAALATSVALFLLVSAEKRGERNEQLAQQIDTWTRRIIPPLWIASMIILHLTVIGFPGSPL